MCCSFSKDQDKEGKTFSKIEGIYFVYFCFFFMCRILCSVEVKSCLFKLHLKENKSLLTKDPCFGFLNYQMFLGPEQHIHFS